MVKLFQIRSIRDAQAADLINCREIDGVQLETISTRRRQYCLSCVRSQWRVVPVDFERQVVIHGITDHEVIDATAEVL